nr:immunoglobulin light chain junction region [Macaca mulatta]MOX11177.1 immunoglobulin light chain junction region [Macaca mulatta]MOX11183.1 immunoglobulin light chain junction region [Macaca mulatta]MOX11184.1 immunoglobulin light chain junction region [Macaca mulatta]MOX11220.1 immunoglobulin light chain junction region [Macaca mulatta]
DYYCSAWYISLSIWVF